MAANRVRRNDVRFSAVEDIKMDGLLFSRSVLQKELGFRLTTCLLFLEVHDTLPQVSEAPGHLIDPGSWVLVKNFQRTKNDQPRWTGPYLVLLSTRSAVRVEGEKNWIHGIHCKRVPFPLPYDRWDQEGIADSETETVPRFLPFSDARVKGKISERESDNNLQEAVPPSIRLNTTEPELLFQNQTVPGKSRYNLRPRTKDK
ncbi:uncharacterized protein [Pleurodeles waltl]|uniref:uncharacterized protein n=1 Tax=Pleurodeles waltl TaxID=8319 RepID=UPI00370992BD